MLFYKPRKKESFYVVSSSPQNLSMDIGDDGGAGVCVLRLAELDWLLGNVFVMIQHLKMVDQAASV